MGDDFDLFPKRENLDPFSFKTREKKPEQQEESEKLFDQEEKPSPPLPDLSPGEPVTEKEEIKDALPSLEPPPLPEPPLESTFDPQPTGPISEEKTFDEPVLAAEPEPEEPGRKRGKTASPFLVIGGALIIIIGLLYGALTFLKRDKPPVPTLPAPAVSVVVEPQTSAPVPVPEPEPQEQVPEEPTEAAQPAPEPAEAGQPEQQVPPATPPQQEKPETQTAPDVQTPPVETAALTPAQDGARYSVQVGALILESSVQGLEKRVEALGYETFRKVGSTTATMNMLTVGPFSSMDDARGALAQLKKSGIESNLIRRQGTGAVIHAGSFLLAENASAIERRISSMGYPVELSKREAKLPLTFVRVGRFQSFDEAGSLRDELKGKGLDAIIVELQ